MPNIQRLSLGISRIKHCHKHSIEISNTELTRHSEHLLSKKKHAHHYSKKVLRTLPLKSLLPLASVWSKTTLNTGGVVGAGEDPQT